MKLFDTFRIESSLSKLLFPIKPEEQYKFRLSRYQSLHHHLGWGLIRGELINNLKF